MPEANQPDYVEEPQLYPYTVSLTSGQHLEAQNVNIDRDADFCLTGVNGSSDGEYTLNFRTPSGRLISTAEILNTDIIGTANQPTAIGPPMIYRAGSVGPQLNITDVSGSTNDIVIVFSGIRRVKTT